MILKITAIGTNTSEHACSILLFFVSCAVVVAAVTAGPDSDPRQEILKVRDYFATPELGPESDSGLEDYIYTEKRLRNPYSWMNNKDYGSPYRWMPFHGKRAPLNPYSWQYMMKKKSYAYPRNPYSWMNYKK